MHIGLVFDHYLISDHYLSIVLFVLSHKVVTALLAEAKQYTLYFRVLHLGFKLSAMFCRLFSKLS